MEKWEWRPEFPWIRPDFLSDYAAMGLRESSTPLAWHAAFTVQMRLDSQDWRYWAHIYKPYALIAGVIKYYAREYYHQVLPQGDTYSNYSSYSAQKYKKFNNRSVWCDHISYTLRILLHFSTLFSFFLPERYLFHSSRVPFGNLENQTVQHPAETTALMRAERQPSWFLWPVALQVWLSVHAVWTSSCHSF